MLRRGLGCRRASGGGGGGHESGDEEEANGGGGGAGEAMGGGAKLEGGLEKGGGGGGAGGSGKWGGKGSPKGAALWWWGWGWCSCQAAFALLMAAGLFVYSLAIFTRFYSENSSCLNGARNVGGGVETGAWWSGNLLELEMSWNRLCYGAQPPEKLRIALFVKKWPVGGTPGGLERHAMTLHRVLAERGHDVHVFTMSGDLTHPGDAHEGNLHIHFVKPNPSGGYRYSDAWRLFADLGQNRSFDIVHSESVALPHWRARDVPNLAASWHGIAYEMIHSDIVHDLIRKPGEARSSELQKVMSERLGRVAEEVRFFHSYRHHVATSDYVSDVLRTVYELPTANVHTILNGVDHSKFRSDPAAGARFRARYGVPATARLVLGAAGRLVRDKGHPLLFEAFADVLQRHKDVYLLIAGEGPWGDRYKELAPNAKTLGPMPPERLAEFYNALDVFVNPTLRSQGLDHTLLEAMQCGKPLLATKFSSITRSVVISSDFGYTFSPNVGSLTGALNAVIEDGTEQVRAKGKTCSDYASVMFTATKMGASYERLFLCMKNETYCRYPLPSDCPPHKGKYLSS